MDFQEAYPDTCSTISRASRLGNIEILKKFIRSGKPVDVRDNRGWQAVHEAGFHGHVECLTILLEEGADVDCRTFEDQTALMLACKAGYSECVDCLLKAGADPNSSTHEDYTPLWEASLKKSLECVKLLISAGAEVNAQNFTLDTPLHGVVQQNDEDMDVVRCLVEAGADLTIQNECGLTPFFIGAQFGLVNTLQYFIEYASTKGEKFKVDLINKGAEDGATPLFLATQNEHVQCVKLLLDHGADPNIGFADPEKLVDIKILPLHMALYKDIKECVSMLVSGTNLEQITWRNNFENNSGYTDNPVAIAVTLDSEECLKILLKHQCCRKLFCGDANLQFLAKNNLFSFRVKIRPAVLITKLFKPFIEKCVRSNRSILHKCIDCVLEDGMQYFPVFLLMLRLGATVDFPRYWLDHVATAVFAVPYFCALLKYSVRGSSDGDYNNDSSCCETVEGNSSVYTCPVRRLSIRKLQLHLTTQSQSDIREGLIREQMGDGYQAVFQPAELHGLHALCRKSVILQLIRGKGYTRRSVADLQIPKQIKNFLLFDDDRSFAGAILNGFEILEKEETDLDRVFEDVSAD